MTSRLSAWRWLVGLVVVAASASTIGPDPTPSVPSARPTPLASADASPVIPSASANSSSATMPTSPPVAATTTAVVGARVFDGAAMQAIATRRIVSVLQGGVEVDRERPGR